MADMVTATASCQDPILLDSESECRFREMNACDPPFPFGTSLAMLGAQVAATSGEGNVAVIGICKHYMRPPFDPTVFILTYFVLMDDDCSYGVKHAAGELPIEASVSS